MRPGYPGSEESSAHAHALTYARSALEVVAIGLGYDIAPSTDEVLAGLVEEVSIGDGDGDGDGDIDIDRYGTGTGV